MKNDFLNMRNREEIETYINLLEERSKELKLQNTSKDHKIDEDLKRIEAKLDALYWALHNSKARAHESFYGK